MSYAELRSGNALFLDVALCKDSAAHAALRPPLVSICTSKQSSGAALIKVAVMY